jgi:hypothetical protein
MEIPATLVFVLMAATCFVTINVMRSRNDDLLNDLNECKNKIRKQEKEYLNRKNKKEPDLHSTRFMDIDFESIDKGSIAFIEGLYDGSDKNSREFRNMLVKLQISTGHNISSIKLKKLKPREREEYFGNKVVIGGIQFTSFFKKGDHLRPIAVVKDGNEFEKIGTVNAIKESFETNFHYVTKINVVLEAKTIIKPKKAV